MIKGMIKGIIKGTIKPKTTGSIQKLKQGGAHVTDLNICIQHYCHSDSLWERTLLIRALSCRRPRYPVIV